MGRNNWERIVCMRWKMSKLNTRTWNESWKSSLVPLHCVFVVTKIIGLETDEESAKEFHLRKQFSVT